MTEAPPQASSDAVGSGVANSVVHDLMRVYENLTQSSTPQTAVAEASRAVSLAYSTAGEAAAAAATPDYPTTTTTAYPPGSFQQQQPPPAANAPLHKGEGGASSSAPPPYNPNTVAPYPHQAGFVPVVPAGGGAAAPPVGNPLAETAAKEGHQHHTQRSGEESHALARTSSTLSTSSHKGTTQQPAADASSESDTGGRSRKKRKSSFADSSNASTTKKSGSSRGKKSKKEDGRWSKRFTWPEDLHRDFVSAIFDVGLKHSSPSTLLEHMPKHEQINTERIKSHLQKYRLHRVKSKKEFISSYEASLRNFQQSHNHPMVSGSAEVAAHLASATIQGDKPVKEEDASPTNALVPHAKLPQQQQQQPPSYPSSADGGNSNDSLMLPQLTDEEKASPIGAAMGYLMGLFFSLKQQLLIQRNLEAAGEKAHSNPLPRAPSSPTAAANVWAVASTAADRAAADQAVLRNAPPPANAVAVPRSHIEVNSMMKREMKNQMALQNKMRALKQQELDKYKDVQDGTPLPLAVAAEATHYEPPTTAEPAVQGAGDLGGTEQLHTTAPQPPHAPPEGGGGVLGIEAATAEDFWNTDVVDDQLFEFLLNS